MARINLETADQTKRQWMEFVDNHDEYSSLTHLINLAVTHEIKEMEGDRPRGRGSATGDASIDTSGMERQMQSMQETVETLSDTVRDLELSNAEEMDQESFNRMLSNAVGFLPAIPPEQTLESLVAINENNPEKRARRSGTVEDIAAAMGEDTYTIEVALSRAERDVPHVKSVREDGVRRYYQEE